MALIKSHTPSIPILVEGEDFYWNDQKLMVLTKNYLLKRGTCCQNNCFHCPYKAKNETPQKICHETHAKKHQPISE